MHFKQNTAIKAASTANKNIRCYSFKDIYIPLPSDDYGTNVQKSLEDKGCTLITDTGSVKVFSDLPGYEFVILVEQTETDYLICCDTWRTYVNWMRNFSMVTHLIEKFLPTQ